MTKSITILDHPSDLGIEARGDSLSEAFERAAVGLMSVIVDLNTVGLHETRRIAVSGPDEQQLLVRWLSEVLYLYDGEKFLGREFSIENFKAGSIDAIVTGESLLESKHRMKLDVKAVTYHQLHIDSRPHASCVRVFFDI